MDDKYKNSISQWNEIFAKDNLEIPKSKETGNILFDDGISWVTKNAKTVLDFGCGSGTILLLCSMYGTQKHIGVDLSTTGIANAKLRSKKMKSGEYTFSVGGIERLSEIESKSIDSVVLSNIIDNLYPTDAKKLLIEIKRILRTNGRVFIKLNPYITRQQIEEYNIKIIEGNLLDDGMILWNNSTEKWRNFIGHYFEIYKYEEIYYPEYQQTNRIFLAVK